MDASDPADADFQHAVVAAQGLVSAARTMAKVCGTDDPRAFAIMALGTAFAMVLGEAIKAGDYSLAEATEIAEQHVATMIPIVVGEDRLDA